MHTMAIVRRMDRPPASSDRAQRQMANQRTRDTGVELALRRALHRSGLRYRVDVAPLPGLRRRADLVFTRSKVAVMVDGCFWHSCPEHGTFPKANGDWWATKLARNVDRDRETNELLTAAGWLIVRVWEHESIEGAAERIQLALSQRGSTVRV